MQRIYLFLLSILFISPLSAQLTEDFADGNFTSNPTWTGDTDEFLVDGIFQLQSNGDTTSASNRKIYLSTASEQMSGIQWEFFVNPKVGTSSNNYMDVFLTSDLPALTGDNKGYFVRIGGTPDEVSLFRKDGSALEVQVIDGVDAQINSSSTNPTKVKVTRDVSGNWNLFADYDGTGALYNFIGTASDLTYTTTEWFGVVVSYSSSNRQKYFMDNIYVGPIIVDNTPPVIQQVKVLTQNSIELVFSENVEQTSAESTENYGANNGLGEPVSAVRNSTEFRRVVLTFNGNFQEGLENTLTTIAVNDLAGNTMASQQNPFLYYRPKPYDVVINEIMADPDPAVELPGVEFLELFNRTDYPINLENWIVRVGTTYRPLPSVTLLADSFLVLTNLEGEEFYSDTIAAVYVPSFSALTNTGASVSLLDPDSVIISTVTYSDSWYNDNSKAEGGWSLEQISPGTPCAGSENWSASNAPGGGTPGKRNSIYQLLADNVPPAIERVVVLSPDTIRVFFTETVQPGEALNVANYTISNGIGVPQQVFTIAPTYKSVKLLLTDQLQAGVLYTITLTDSLLDCTGNPFNVSSTGRFAIPELAIASDIVINEILTNPKDDGSDFVEIYNRSNKIIDLASLQLSSMDTATGALTGAELITEEGYLFFPGEYLVLTEDIAGVKDLYYTSNPDGFYEMGNFPTYNNDDAVIVLSAISDELIVDELVFNSSMHFALLNDLGGVTLERINFDRPSDDKTNWNSAAATVGYGTPAYRNSQYSEITESQKGSIAVSPEVFSPDNDGFEDALDISYAFDLPGFTGSITIYDSNGRLVKYLVRNKLLGTSGLFTWNGVNELNEKARLGIYVVYMEAFDLEGNIVKTKKACVLGGKLN